MSFSNETIIIETGVSNNQFSRVVTPKKKHDTYDILNYRLTREGKATGYPLKYKDENTNVLHQAIDQCPLFANLFTGRKYDNILFVSHMAIQETSWMTEAGGDVDKILHLIPIIMEYWGYLPQITTLKPPQSKYVGTLHRVYENFKLPSVVSNTQYEFGLPHDFHVTTGQGDLNTKYDAIVFLNVPSIDNQSFTFESVKHHFRNVMTYDCELVDLYIGDKTGRFEGTQPLPVSFTIPLESKYDISKVSTTKYEELLKNVVQIYGTKKAGIARP
jgi:hypothetical protein